jgi:hypothetical protein
MSVFLRSRNLLATNFVVYITIFSPIFATYSACKIKYLLNAPNRIHLIVAVTNNVDSLLAY